MRSVMTHQFSLIPHTSIPRSVFNRSHGYKTTFDSGYLIPFFIDEVLPGDTVSLSASLFGRLATPIVPIMDNIFLETFYFYVPQRLLWLNWQPFCGEQENPGDSTDYLMPQIVCPPGGWAVGSLSDYLGLPTQVPNLKDIRACWHRAYNLIWNEWFRDQNLQDSVPVPKDDGPDDDSNYKLLRRGKRHDYFTSCLPWPQKGPGVELPLGTQAPVYTSAEPNPFPYTPGGGNPLILKRSSNWAHVNDYTLGLYGGNLATTSTGATGDRINVAPTNLYADLSNATAATINSLRQAFQIQKLLERDARGGTRYTEILRSHFGVISPDARLQRPEYLGGSHTRIAINPVQQTSSTDEVSPQGNLAAFGVFGDNFHGFSKSFVEHGVILGLVNVRADLTYQQGINRKFTRKTRYDFYWPALAHLGEQAVLNREIFAQGTPDDERAFGYGERWSEYRYFPSQITGQFRSTYSLPLDIWHLSQKFENLPTLSSQFIQDNPPMKRILANIDGPEILFDSYITYRCARPMPTYSVPGLIDHF